MPFVVYAVVATLAFSLFGRTNLSGLLAGVVAGGIMYLGIAVLMVKFGWNPPQWGGARQARESSTATAKTSTKAATTDGPKPKPQPTTRTNAGNARAKRSR